MNDLLKHGNWRCPSAAHGRRALASALVSLLAVVGTAQAQDGTVGSGQAGSYIGVFVGPGSLDVRMTDIDGFTGSNGVPGQAFEYGDTGLATGVMVGRSFRLGGVQLLFEADGAFSGRVGHPRTVGSGRHGRNGVGGAALGRDGAHRPSEVPRPRRRAFVAGGMSVAGISNSFTDLDPGTDGRLQPDPDDSFDERPTRVGWVAGVGIEMPVASAWTLRLEGLYNDFGETVHQAENRLDVNAGVCGPAGLPSPCRYGFDQRLALLRLVFVRHFGR